MANLGGFAGGLAQGYQSGEKMKMAQQELDDNKGFRERQMKIMEADEAEKEVVRKRDKDFRDGADALQKQYYGSQQVQTGSQQVTNADGTVTEQPIYQTVQKKVGDDPLHDLRYKIDMGSHLIKGDPKGVAEHMKFVQNAVDTQTGQDIEGTIAGNKDAFARLGKSQGFDPMKASFATDPKTGDPVLDTGDGRKINLRNIAAGLSVKQAYESIRQTQQDALARAKGEAEVGNLGASAEHLRAEAKMLPAKEESLRAGARHADASAGLAGKQGNLIDAKIKTLDAAGTTVTPKASAAISRVLKDSALPPAASAAAQMLAESAVASGMSPEAAGKSASAFYFKAMTDAKKAKKGEPDVLAMMIERAGARRQSAGNIDTEGE